MTISNSVMSWYDCFRAVMCYRTGTIILQFLSHLCHFNPRINLLRPSVRRAWTNWCFSCICVEWVFGIIFFISLPPSTVEDRIHAVRTNKLVVLPFMFGLRWSRNRICVRPHAIIDRFCMFYPTCKIISRRTFWRELRFSFFFCSLMLLLPLQNRNSGGFVHHREI